MPPFVATTSSTFQAYLFYRAVADLRRSWRIVLPNLEQCGLLVVDYVYLDEVVGNEEFWAGVPLVSGLSVTDRRDFILTDPRLLPSGVRAPQRELPHPVAPQGKREALS